MPEPTTPDAGYFAHIGDPTRRAIVSKLLEGPSTVKTLSADLPVSQPAVSQHLKILKNVGLVMEERDGKYHRYSLDPAAMEALLTELDGFRERVSRGAWSNQAGKAPQCDVVDETMASWASLHLRSDPLTMGILLRLRLVAVMLEKRIAGATARMRLSVVEFRLLATLERIGPPNASTLTELSRLTLLSLPGASKYLARAEKRQLIERMPNAEDGRSNLLRLTEKGRTLLHKAMLGQRDHELAPIYNLPLGQKQRIAEATRILLHELKLDDAPPP